MRVNVDEKAYNDPRMRRLAALLGWHVDHAVGAAVRLWMAALNRVTTENPSGVMTREEADFCTDHGAKLVDAMIEAKIAHPVDNSSVYFSGIEERGGFLVEQRLKGAKGGRNRAKSKRLADATADSKQTLKPMLSKGSSLISGSGSVSVSGSGSVLNTECARLWELQEDLRAEAIPRARRLEPTKDRLKRLADRLVDNTPEDCEHVLRVYAEDAKRDPAKSAEWFNGVTNWRKDNFDRALGRTPTRPVAQSREPLPASVLDDW